MLIWVRETRVESRVLGLFLVDKAITYKRIACEMASTTGVAFRVAC